RRGVRQLVDEHDIVGQPPLGDLAVVETEHRLPAQLRTGSLHDDQQWALVPLGMAYADYRGFGDGSMPDRDVIQVDRAYPLTAGLDHFLGTGGDLQVAALVDRSDVAGREPTVARERVASSVLEVAAQDPRPAHQQVARHLPVARQLLASAVDDLHLHPV